MYRVLLVDDEESVLKVLKTSIDWLALGVDTPVTAADGVQALEAMERSPFHLLIADIKMPRMGGLELIRRVRQLYPETRCILLTAYSEFDYAKEAIRLGVENYLLKPVQKEELESTVQNAMANLYSHRGNGGNLLYENILHRWLAGAISGEELSERAGVLGLNLFLPQYCAVGILKRRQDSSTALFRSACLEQLGRQYEVYHCWNERGIFVLILGGRLLGRMELEHQLRALAGQLDAAGLEQAQTSCCCLPESVWPDCYSKDGRLYCRGLVFDAVAGDERFFPELPHLGGAAFDEAAPPDCRCDPPQPKLRVRHFRRCGAECWLLVNEGEAPIRARIAFPGAARLGGYDLWAGRAFRLCEGDTAALELPRRGSLLVFACGADDWAALPPMPAAVLLPEADFRLTAEDPDAVQKIYEADYTVSDAQLAAGSLRLPVQAEEMCELRVNGRDAGAVFWSPCSFELKGLLHPGVNRLRLTVTGSLANRYGLRPVPYGLGVAETL